MQRRLVILDDDPTGIQTVHGCLLVTGWDEDTIRMALTDRESFFYILTNTRALTRHEAAAVVREIMQTVIKVNREYGFQLVFISRSDSCLRGHFPLETDIMREVLQENGIPVWPKVPFVPAFIEAGRVTVGGVHYMKDGGKLVPVSETEFARDNVFGYHTSVLSDYIVEKGADPADYQIVDAADYDELRAFVREFGRQCGDFPGAVVIRSSSSLPKAMSGIADIPLLDRSILAPGDGGVGCFVAGSHVGKTTRQLEQLLSCEGTHGIEIPVGRILDDAPALFAEIQETVVSAVGQGCTPVLYTSRSELRLGDADSRQHLGQRISAFLVDIVEDLPFKPSYLVAKGGITSNDILTKGLHVKTARVLGQIISGVPCINAGRFPYVIFPGNVGDGGSLVEVYQKLKSN